jgi:hypothetical protein
MRISQQVRTQVLKDGRITDNEVSLIRDAVQADGRLDMADVKLLVELLSEAVEVCPAFDELFFPVLRKVLLEDGRILADEQYYLLKMLYSDGVVRDVEREFLRELQREVEPSPDFNRLCETAFASPDRNWSLGGGC